MKCRSEHLFLPNAAIVMRPGEYSEILGVEETPKGGALASSPCLRSTVDPVEVLSVLIPVAAIPTAFWNITQVEDNRFSERIGQQVAYVFG